MPPEDPPAPQPGDRPEASAGGPSDPSSGPAEFRPGGVRVLVVAWWAVAGFLAVDLALRGSMPGALLGTGALAVTCALAHALYWRPAVRVDARGVELVNVWRTARLPWSSLEDLDTRWVLTLTAGGRRWTAWAAPASGRRLRPVRRSETAWAERGAESIAGSRAPGSSAGEAAVLVQTRWERWRHAPPAERAAGEGAPTSVWDVGALVPLGAAVGLLLVGLLVVLA